MMVELRTEHHITDLHDLHLAQKHTGRVQHREHRRVATTDTMDNLTQFGIGRHTLIIALDDRIQIHQRQHGMVGMMGNELTFLGQTRTIDAMRLEDNNSKVRAYGHNHQRHKKTITAREFGNEKHTGQRGMHHTRHDTGHAHQSEILLGDIHTDLVDVPQTREQETRETAHKQTRREGTTTTATAIRGRTGNDLRQQNQSDIAQDQTTLTREQGVVENLVPVGLGTAIEQQVDAAITLAIKGREQEDEQTQNGTANGQTDIRMVLVTGEDPLAETHHPDEIERDESTGDAQEHTGGDALNRPLTVEMEGEQRRITTEDIGETRRRDTRHQYGQKRRHGHVDHQHLKGEHQACYRGLEDTGNGSGRTTTDKGHQRLTVEMEDLTEVRTNGGAGQHNRRLGSHRATKADGYGRGNDRRPGVMRTDARLVGGDGIEDARDAMGNIVLDNVTHKEGGEIDTHHGIDQVEPVGPRLLERTGQEHHNLVDDPMQGEGCHCGEETH